mgnify:CR=1 FL=1
MATYINIHGQKIQYVSSDPASPQTGQVWYNSTSNTLKYRAVQAANAWSTGGALTTGRGDLSGAGARSDSKGTLVATRIKFVHQVFQHAWILQIQPMPSFYA